MQDLDAVNEQLEDPNLTVTQRKGLWNLKIRVRHSIAEECGQLTLRQVLSVESAPLTHTVTGWNRADWAQRLATEGPYTPPPVAPDGPAAEPGATPTPAPDPEKRHSTMRFLS
jgi:hypothetical protein